MGSDFGEEGRQRLCAKGSVAQICADSFRAGEDSEFRDRTDIFLQAKEPQPWPHGEL